MNALTFHVVALFTLLALATPALASDRFPTTVPARVGDQRFVRASYTREAQQQSERTVIVARVAVLAVDARGYETEGTLEIERCQRIVNGAATELLPPGQRLLLKRGAGGRIEFFDAGGGPLAKEVARQVSLVAGLRGGTDDLDFWQRGDAPNDWPVDEAKVRKVIATADFDPAAVRSQTRAVPGDITARLSIPKLVGKAKDSPLVDGTFAVECRWRVGAGLERFRRTRWVLHERKGSDAHAPLTTRVVEIVGIESATSEPWWAKTQDEVRDEAVNLARANDPLLGFYCRREVEPALKHALGGLEHRADAALALERDPVTSLLKVKGVGE